MIAIVLIIMIIYAFIFNKIIPIETIIEVANYLEDQKEEYKRLFESEKNKNINLKYSEQVYQYKGDEPKVQYTIKFKDGKELTEANYNWFVGMLNNLKAIQEITFYYVVNYSSNYENREHYEYMHVYTWVHFREDTTTIRVDGKNMEEQVYRIHSYLRGTIENNDDRYNKTVRNRKLRIQSLSFSIGFVLSYILYFILLANKSKLPIEYANYLNNKYILVLGQWFVAAIIGNIFGLPIMMALYRNIIPKAKYSHYSRSSHKSVYVDNIDDFTSHNEVQIGKYTDNGKNRVLIEKIYKITSKIVLVQLVLSILYFIILK